MTDGDRSPRPGRVRASRRQFLLGGAVAGVGAATAVGLDLALSASPSGAPGEAAAGALPLGLGREPFFGPHQAGIATEPPAHLALLALDLLPETDREALGRLMRVLTDDAARLTEGRPALADSEPELAVVPARLTVTFGFGPGFVARAGGDAPAWLRPLEPFAIDRLEDRWTGGDLLLALQAEDPTTLAHAQRMLLKDSRSFAVLRWVQSGFRRAAGAEAPGTTVRNLFGQVDGTANASPDSPEFAQQVWVPDGWLAGGTSLVIRRIRMDLEGWDRLDRSGREQAVGRRLDTGAPLTGQAERDAPDFSAVDRLGFPVIPDFSHMRRAHTGDVRDRIVRRGFNFDDAPSAGISESGLIFLAFQADVDRQFTPIQRRLAELDLLNKWTTPIGSAVFAIPPGCQPGGFVGETLLG